jgi:hypothetical protein
MATAFRPGTLLGEALLSFLGGCYLDGLGHSQDLLPARLVIVRFVGMLFEMSH